MWYCYLRSTSMLVCVLHYRLLQADRHIRKSSLKNIEINPHSVGSHFELPVVAFPHRIRLQECFGYVPVPQVVAATIGIGVREHMQLAIPAFESQIQHLRRPQNPDLGFALLVSIFALPVGTTHDLTGLL